MTKHTPGPWRVDARKKEGTSKGYAYVLVRANGALGQVATVFENHEANARLIAAAPELLALLQSAVYREDNRHKPGFGDVSLGCLSTAIRAALTKVEGNT